ncbi:hypothetical protein CK820_G0013989 [Pan troglodytes]|uniref:Uncharacterized protein n=1 Tax=Pan troglodytes TaxID=9598 RepID=A0A2J8QU45_PANTR|nr:hypothetical protein CK820_G0013989 [Pan troglodytes]
MICLLLASRLENVAKKTAETNVRRRKPERGACLAPLILYGRFRGHCCSSRRQPSLEYLNCSLQTLHPAGHSCVGVPVGHSHRILLQSSRKSGRGPCPWLQERSGQVPARRKEEHENSEEIVPTQKCGVRIEVPRFKGIMKCHDKIEKTLGWPRRNWIKL